jgi:hypothetical protein
MRRTRRVAEEPRAELRSEQERHLRTRADFDNYKRRVERDRATAAGLDGVRLRSVLDAEGVKVGRGYLWNGKFFGRARVRAAE